VEGVFPHGGCWVVHLHLGTTAVPSVVPTASPASGPTELPTAVPTAAPCFVPRASHNTHTDTNTHISPHPYSTAPKHYFDLCEDFWKEDVATISMWQRFAHLSFLFMPSSANVERVLSFLKYLYTHQQTSMKLDKVEGKGKIRYNGRKKVKKWFRKDVRI
jgi:hypothetical protein